MTAHSGGPTEQDVLLLPRPQWYNSQMIQGVEIATGTCDEHDSLGYIKAGDIPILVSNRC